MSGGIPVGGDQLRPLSVGESLSTAMDLYRRTAVSLWTITAAVIIPIEILVTIVRRVTLPGDVFLHDGTLYTFSSGRSTGGGVALLVVGILNLVGVLLATGAVFHLLLDARLGRPHDVGESFAYASHRLLSLLWLAVVVCVMLVIGFILIFLPGIWLLVATSVAIPVLMLEGTKGFRAAFRSLHLVSGRWWATFGTLLVAFILYFGAIFVLSAIGSALASGTANVTLYEVIIGVVTAVGYILVAPFWAAVVSVIYIDLRVRKEGLDHGTLAQRPREPGTTVPAPTG